MRRSFVSLACGDRYQVGCTGQTVYVLDAAGSELARFRDMPYAYFAALHPGGEIAAVYSQTGLMAIYSLAELRLIKRFRVSSLKDTQVDRIPCFSPDGLYLYHIEGRKGDSLCSRLSVYSTVDYRPVRRLFAQGEETLLHSVDVDSTTGEVYLLGYFRQGIQKFIAKVDGETLLVRPLRDRNMADDYRAAIWLRQHGFTNNAYQHSLFARAPEIKAFLEGLEGRPVDMGPFNRTYSLEELKETDLSLAHFWAENANIPVERHFLPANSEG